MLSLQEDLATVFYSSDFATPMRRERSAALDVTVMAIVGTVDDEVLDGRAIAATRTARFAASHDVRADDKLITLQAIGSDLPAGSAFRVLDKPRRVGDGLELEALLGSASA